MFKKILLPLDGTDVAEAAITYGESLARQTGAELVLLHACTEEHNRYHTMHRLYLEKRAEIIAAGTSQGTSPAVTAVTLFGEPVTVVTDYVNQNGVDLIIMVRESRPEQRSTAVFDEVFKSVSCPSLLVSAQPPEPGRAPFTHIMVALDGTPGSEKSLAPAIALAQAAEAEITLFSMAREVYDAEPESDLVGDRGLYDREISLKKQEKVGEYLEQLVRRLRLEGLEVNARVDIGNDSAQLITAAARVMEADLVVMATASVVSTWRAKSVTHKLLAESELPLLVVRQ
ncbi:UspA domain protein [Dehalogenimonas lykanthroporepellens BL-DC-9]|jgi:nucleotide-binding universal stress UspA family protein|nr:UspA domain protein [Dehalogenimonas lykanthroporepellens BL-DC-9]